MILYIREYVFTWYISKNTSHYVYIPICKKYYTHSTISVSTLLPPGQVSQHRHIQQEWRTHADGKFWHSEWANGPTGQH